MVRTRIGLGDGSLQRDATGRELFKLGPDTVPFNLQILCEAGNNQRRSAAPSCWQYCASIDVGSHGCVLHELDTGRQFHVEAGRHLHWWIIFKQQTSHHSVKEGGPQKQYLILTNFNRMSDDA
jgi:hypothetical protein